MKMAYGRKLDIIKIMEIEEYKEWIPTNDLPVQFYLFELFDQRDGLTILLKNINSSERKFKIVFNDFLAYKIVRESGRIKTLGNLSFGGFNSITDSEFISWFKEEGQGIYDDRDLVQYSICCLDKIIDIISVKPPVVGWLDR